VAAAVPYTCHPVNLAGNIALIDEASQGRAYLGLARGGWLDFIGVEQPRPITVLREAFECVRHLLSGSKEPYPGEIFPLAGGESLRWPVYRPDIPFLLGTWGPQTIRACVQHVSEVKVGGTANPGVVPQIRAAIDAAGAPEVGVVVGAVTVVDEDGPAAKTLARREAALYLSIIATLDHSLNLEPELLARINEASARYDFEQVGACISDDLLRRLAFAGTPDEVAQQAVELFEAGVSRVEFGTPHGLSAEEGVRLLGEKVLPSLRTGL
jgi:5,10-methylenetetrahydromethanopterin reductase